MVTMNPKFTDKLSPSTVVAIINDLVNSDIDEDTKDMIEYFFNHLSDLQGVADAVLLLITKD